jgi:hypothetical protein
VDLCILDRNITVLNVMQIVIGAALRTLQDAQDFATGLFDEFDGFGVRTNVLLSASPLDHPMLRLGCVLASDLGMTVLDGCWVAAAVGRGEDLLVADSRLFRALSAVQHRIPYYSGPLHRGLNVRSTATY